MLPRFLLPLSVGTCLILGTLGPSSCRAQDDEPVTSDGPWISSVAWLNDNEIVGTSSQGLLLRPAEVVKVTTENLTELASIGQAESSLWSVLPVSGDKVVASDYKGGILIFGEGEGDTFEVESRWIRALSKSPEEGEFLAGTEDGKLLVLTVADKKETRRIDAHSAAIFDIAINSAGDKVATVAGDGSVKVFSWPKLELLGEMSHGSEAIWSVVFSPDGTRLITGGADRAIQLWDAEKFESIVSIAKTSDWITDLVTLPNSTVVVAACMNGKLVVADYASMHRVTTTDATSSGIWSAAISPNGKQIVMGTRKNGFALIDIPDWTDQAEKVASEAAKIRPPSPE